MYLSSNAMIRITEILPLSMQGEKSAVRYLFRKGLEVNSRSRYVHLSWGIFERDNGQVDNARELFKRGHLLNLQDAPILQVRQASRCGPETAVMRSAKAGALHVEQGSRSTPGTDCQKAVCL